MEGVPGGDLGNVTWVILSIAKMGYTTKQRGRAVPQHKMENAKYILDPHERHLQVAETFQALLGKLQYKRI